jgi:hypothetical protein
MTNILTLVEASNRPLGPEIAKKNPITKDPEMLMNKVPQETWRRTRPSPSAPVARHAAKRAADCDPEIGAHRARKGGYENGYGRKGSGAKHDLSTD